jgi:hypothetical protein
MKTYETCPQSVADRVAALIKKSYPDLINCNTKVDLLFVSTNSDGPALCLHGYPCAAVVRALRSKDRAAGRGDAEIVIDRVGYEAMTDLRRDALLDHELYHLEVALDRAQRYKVDGEGRPILKMRKHDREFGWFDEIARRHGENSFEIRQARNLLGEQGQLYFNLEPSVAS